MEIFNMKTPKLQKSLRNFLMPMSLIRPSCTNVSYMYDSKNYAKHTSIVENWYVVTRWSRSYALSLKTSSKLINKTFKFLLVQNWVAIMFTLVLVMSKFPAIFGSKFKSKNWTQWVCTDLGPTLDLDLVGVKGFLYKV